MTAPLVVANCSGFYGDRLSAMREVLSGGPVDVVTGDWLAELTLLLLGRQQLKDPSAGYARTFLTQLEDCLGTAVQQGVRIVSNAGGLNPAGLAAAVSELACRLGLTVRVATVTGDDLLPRLGSSDVRRGERPPGHDSVTEALTANAYLGCWGVVEALTGGADVVVTGRVTDASLVVGPAAWHHGWSRDDLDQLAGATVAGHVLECGTQATGGGFSFFTELLDADPAAYDSVGFPLAEIASDGTFVVTKHPGTGGAVTVETVTEQLLYECTGAAYGGPDVVTRFDTLALEQVGLDRVHVGGAVGLPPTGWLKVATNALGGWRNSITLPLTGLQVEAKAALLQRQLAPVLAGITEVDVVLARTDSSDATTQERASALLHITVKDPVRDRVGKAFTAPVVELGLSSIPGFHAGLAPSSPSAYGVYSPAWVAAADVPSVVTLPDGTTREVTSAHETAVPTAAPELAPCPAPPGGPTRLVALGSVFGARSGDKGGAVTLGVYARGDLGFGWLVDALTVERLQELLPEAAGLAVTREVLPGLRAVLFQVPGLLGLGVAAGTRFDPQGKAVGEWLRSRLTDLPVALLEEAL